MGKILFNPENGAEIKNFVFKNEHFMDAKEGQSFVTGMVVNVDDELAEFMLDTWGFLQELSVDEAKEYLDGKEAYKCEKCEFTTKVRIGFEGHKRKHLKDAQIDGLGILTVTRKNDSANNPNATQESRQKKWDEEDKERGLIGEGLTEDHV